MGQTPPAKTMSFTGWLVVGVCLLVTAIRSGVGTQTLGFIIQPMRVDLGWTATAITACITGQHVVASVFAPLTGKLLDRFGGRAVVTTGVILDGIALILISQVTSLWQFALVMALLGGFAEACIGNALIMPYVAKWFVRRRGLAIGLVSTGASLGGAIISPVVVVLSEYFGWRGAWLGVGLIPIVLIAPPAFLILRSDPESVGQSPDGDAGKAYSPAVDEFSFTLKQALRTRAFWLLLIAWNLCDFAMKGAMLNKIPYALEMGFSLATAGALITIYGISAALAKLTVGWMADRFSPRLVGASMAAVQAVSLFAFVDSSSHWQLYFSYGVFSGFSSGGLIALMPLLLADFFGRKHQGTISGVTVPLLLLSSIGGPMVAAGFSDITGSYAGGFISFAVCAALASAVLLFVHRPARPADRDAAGAADRGAV